LNFPETHELQNGLEQNIPDSCKSSHEWEYDSNDYISETHCIKQCKTCSKIVVSDRPHQFGEWRYVDDKSCHQERECLVCDKVELSQMQQHIYSDWEYITDDSCKQIKRCQRCGHIQNHRFANHVYKDYGFAGDKHNCIKIQQCKCGVEKQVVLGKHQLGNWEYAADENCEQVLKCKRCGKITDKKIKHDWTKWKFTHPHKCDQIIFCKRCKEIADRRIADHDYSDWQYETDDSCKQIIKCKRCNTIKAQRAVDHNYGDWEYVSDNNCEQIIKCKRCGVEFKRRLADHQYRTFKTVKTNSCEKIIKCNRCGFVKHQYLEHDFCDWKYPYNNYQQVRQCNICGEIEERKLNLTLWQKKNNLNYEGVYTAFKKYSVKVLWHMTHYTNIPNILKYGLLNHYDSINRNLNNVDISNPEVQKWRDGREEIYNHRIHDYAPLYINPRNPMLYVRRRISSELCLIEVTLSVLAEHKFLVSDGNAASRNTVFYNKLNHLSSLPWEVINTNFWPDFDEGKRKMCSEVLIYPNISPDYIGNIHCCSKRTIQLLSGCGRNVCESNHLFF
jgi:hypothetical protein